MWRIFEVPGTRPRGWAGGRIDPVPETEGHGLALSDPQPSMTRSGAAPASQHLAVQPRG